jgi:hypothetical protein
MLCTGEEFQSMECELPVSTHQRLIGYYHRSGTTPHGATFEVVHAEPVAD